MSIHKSQGQSSLFDQSGRILLADIIALDRVKVDLGKVFEKGQGKLSSTVRRI
jgi:hypothetical protein